MAKVKLELQWQNLDKAFAGLEEEVTDIVRGITVEAFQQILLRTPQYYGRMVVSYTYSIGRPIFVDRSFVYGKFNSDGQWEPHSWAKVVFKGHLKAVKNGSFFNVGREMSFRLGDTVYISNGADHGEGQYSADVAQDPNGAPYLRAVNRPGNAATKALAFLNSKYSKNVSRYMARKLKTLQITDF